MKYDQSDDERDDPEESANLESNMHSSPNLRSESAIPMSSSLSPAEYIQRVAAERDFEDSDDSEGEEQDNNTETVILIFVFPLFFCIGFIVLSFPF